MRGKRDSGSGGSLASYRGTEQIRRLRIMGARFLNCWSSESQMWKKENYWGEVMVFNTDKLKI